MTKKLIIATFSAAVLAVSCTPKATPVTSESSGNSANLAQGKTIFENSCKRCHALPNPTDHSAQDWVGILNAMAPKAKLTDEQHQLVYNYIVSVKN